MSVNISHQGKTYSFSPPSSCTPKRLKQVFSLLNEPDFILKEQKHEDQPNEVIFWNIEMNSWEKPLEDGYNYLIQIDIDHKNKESLLNRDILDYNTSTTNNNIDNELFIDRIRHSILCSQSLTQKDPILFLNDNIHFHSINTICKTIDVSPICYGIFLSMDQKTIYVSFRGTFDKNDVRSDFDFFVEDQFNGKVHKGFWQKASLVPIEPFIEMIINNDNDDKNIIFCGHSMGGAIAQLITLRIMEYFILFMNNNNENNRKSKNIKYFDKISCISIGSPLVASDSVNNWINSYLNESYNNNIIFNIINVDDPVPKLLNSNNDIKLENNILDLVNMGTPWNSKYNELAFKLSSEIFKSYKTIDSVSNIVLPLIQYSISDYKPLGSFGIIYRDSKMNCKFIIENDSESILRILKIKSKKIQNSLYINHYLDTYWKIFLELSNNDKKYNGKLYSKFYDNNINNDKNKKRKRIIKSKNLFPLSNDAKVIIAKNNNENRCKLVISESNNIWFLDPLNIEVNGIPIEKKKKKIIDNINLNSNTTNNNNLKIQLIQKPTKTKVEFQCYLMEDRLFSSYPSIKIYTHFDSKNYQIFRIDNIDGLTNQEKSIDIFNFNLFQKIFQRSLSEYILFENRKQLESIFTLEKIILQSSNIKEFIIEYKRKYINNNNIPIHEIIGNDIIINILDKIYNYFSNPLILSEKVKKRTYAKYAVPLLIGSISAFYFSTFSFGFGGLGLGGLSYLYDKYLKNQGEHNNIQILRIMLDEIYYDKNNIDLVKLESSSIEYDCMMLEKALFKKSENLNILNRSINDLNNNSIPPIFPNLKNILDDNSYIKLLQRLKSTCILYNLKIHLSKLFYLGIIGPQNSGKTTLTNILLDKNIEETGDNKHTIGANIYNVSSISSSKNDLLLLSKENLVIVDYAGQTSTKKEIADIANNCGAMISSFIFITDFRGDPENINLYLLEDIIKFDCPILICVNQISRREDSIPNNETLKLYQKSWEDYIISSLNEKYKNYFNIDDNNDNNDNSTNYLNENINIDLTIFMTEFRDYTPNLKEKGVKSINDVKYWINEKMELFGFKTNINMKSKL